MNYYKILQNQETTIDCKRMHYSYMKEVSIIYNYILKDLDNTEEIHKVEVMMNKALEIEINKLVEN